MGLVFDRGPQVLQRELLPILGLLHPRHAPLHPRHPRRDCLRVRWSSPPSPPRARVVPLTVGRRGAEGRGEGGQPRRGAPWHTSPGATRGATRRCPAACASTSTCSPRAPRPDGTRCVQSAVHRVLCTVGIACASLLGITLAAPAHISTVRGTWCHIYTSGRVHD